MLQHSRRALSNIAAGSEVSTSTEELKIDLLNLLTSAFVDLFAIYFASYASLRVWKAFEAYDANHHVGTPMKRCKFWAPLVFSLVGLVFWFGMWYSAAADLETLSVWMVGASVAIFATVGISAPLLAVFTDAEVHRVVGKGWIFPVIRRVKEHKRHACRIVGLSAVLGVCAAVSFHHSILSFAVGGVVYAFVVQPSLISPRGWMSIRGMIIFIYATVLLCLSFTAVVVFSVTTKEESGQESVFVPIAEKTFPFSRLVGHLMNGYVGVLAALILRYEYTLSPDRVLVENPDLDSNTNVATPEKRLKTDTPAAEVARPTVRVPRAISSFSAPLFHMTLIAYFLVHVPALILATPFFQYLWKATSPPTIHHSSSFSWSKCLLRSTFPSSFLRLSSLQLSLGKTDVYCGGMLRGGFCPSLKKRALKGVRLVRQSKLLHSLPSFFFFFFSPGFEISDRNQELLSLCLVLIVSLIRQSTAVIISL
ncbi:uncharacterized protein EI90DRAFT_35922 [Cantharellus anzutake]|uniref:uncharacterized protein n=1 Tax=Cantharellus anzutake TaxID=1750568 RepID=UPI001904C653|nr:uncharacterized protein EI90DRAFT_35922 [Cantharellus anzutake]KAF8343996.1 hypothetical protein EI90DRAFT_35922 [Cantharellus anzutake]